MIGRFCHFYPGYTRKTALQENWRAFLAMLNAIPALEAEDDLRALTVAAIGANPGEKNATFKDYSKKLQQVAGLETSRRKVKDSVAPGLTPGVEALTDGDALLSELHAKRAAWAAERGKALA